MLKYLCLAGIFLSILWTSCGDQSLDEIPVPTGEEYINGNSNVFYVDTFTLNVSNAIQDSVITSNTDVALVGKYSHEEFGEIEAKSVFRIKAAGFPNLDLDKDVFDSITICLDYNSYYFGDTTKLASISLFKLESDFINNYRSRVQDDVQFGYYNNSFTSSGFKSSQTPLLEYDFYPRPSKGKSLELKLNDDFGIELFEKIANDDFNDPDTRRFDANRFYEYIQGFVLKNNSDNKNSIIGFKALAEDLSIKLYYNGNKRDFDRDKEEYVKPRINFALDKSNFQFNSIESERVGTVLETLLNRKEEVGSDKTNNRAYLQSGTGLQVKVEFPSLEEYFRMRDFNSIVKAELEIIAVKDIDKLNNLPIQLFLYRSSDINNRGAIVSTRNNEPIPMVLKMDRNDFENQFSYSIDITQELIRELLDGEYDREFSFLIGMQPGTERTTLTSLIIGGHNAERNFRPKLKLYTYEY